MQSLLITQKERAELEINIIQKFGSETQTTKWLFEQLKKFEQPQQSKTITLTSGEQRAIDVAIGLYGKTYSKNIAAALLAKIDSIPYNL